MADLTGKKVLALASQGLEQIELTSPREALEGAGATVTLASPDGKEFQGMEGDWEKKDFFTPELKVSEAKAEDYDALLLPGGTLNADAMRLNKDARALVRAFLDAEKPVAAICHAPWLLIDSGVVEGRTLTSYESIAPDLKNAGANWVDQEVAIDGTLVTSRNPSDLEAFNAAIIEKLA
ncbi:type 1 glutamine amidotransferase domain-containing protein [Rothia sp. ZJ1223]|uniref:type 1 glutamine amidotransferase domain-containing protein n=1 Tax=Rothia sp. ZJ1223 TaxID=2811098 RepID=UPI00195E9D0E|nr:type 1 glutamine amidotransferase domain-containing protein [Rothia sp. ZJ1223]MBM7052294.1 type 1 glutamine amidotransferase [Rothia sp. ZJ1223]